MLKKKNDHKNDILVIADCLEADYPLYRKLYSKLARRFGFKKENVFVVTEKTFKQLAIFRREKIIDMPLGLFSDQLIVNLSKVLYLTYTRSKTIYCLCNIKRQTSFNKFTKLFDEDVVDKMRVQCFGYYTDVCGVEEHPITKAMASKMITNGNVVCTTSLTPDKNYLEELTSVLSYLQSEKEV